MTDADGQLALVRKALCSGLSNCVEWIGDDVQQRIRNDANLQGLTPRAIKQLVVELVKQQVVQVVQKKEERANWKAQRDYWYYALLPVDGLPRPLFVEMELTDDDDDCPVVSLLNAHLTSF